MKIAARDIRFEFADDIPSHWSGQPEFSHCVNAFMAALPCLEPYFIQNIREAGERIADPRLRADIEGFVAQEGRHAQQHRRFNQLLAKRYPELPSFERALRTQLDASRRQHSLAYRMAYTAGYEALTYQLVCFVMEERKLWFSQADPRMLGLLCWHGAEEVEHKAVAYETFQAVHGGYFLRVRGLVAALVKTLRDIRTLAKYMLQVDGLWSDAHSRARLRSVRRALAFRLGPRFRHYCLPRYAPTAHADPPLLLAWLERHRAGRDLRVLSLSGLEGLSAEGAPRPSPDLRA